MSYRFCITLSLFAILWVPAVAQQLQCQPGWSGYEDADLKLPGDADLLFKPHVNVEWFAIQFKNHPPVYGIDQWSGVVPEVDGVKLPDVLVFFYDASWDTSMKQRIREAKVVDEQSTFPVAVASLPYRRCGGSVAVVKPQPPIFAPVSPSNVANRYAEVPKHQEPFVIIDLAESEHLGMAPGYRGAFQP